MNALILSPVILSLLMLAAHFLRSMSLVIVGMCLLCIPLLALRRRWVPWLIEIVLLLGALEWLATMVTLMNQRIEEGRDWKRMAIILFCVMTFTAVSGIVFLIPRIRRFYARSSGTGFPITSKPQP